MVGGSESVRLCAGQSPLGSTSPKDVASGVSISVVLVTALLTSKLRLADAIRDLDVPALGTSLTRVAGSHANDLSTGALCLAKNHFDEDPPPRIEY
jgi:hypothetical protein